VSSWSIEPLNALDLFHALAKNSLWTGAQEL